MRISTFLLSLAFVCISFATSLGQVHLFPENGGPGIAGTIPNSFIIGWKQVKGAIGYEYVVSDNPLCFSGCAGDTREAFTTDTNTVQFNMEPSRWYYWITRIYYGDGDTSQWSLISSFFTEKDDGLSRLVTVAPNPVVGNEMNLRIDWAINPEASQIQVRLLDQYGTLLQEHEFPKRIAGVRFEEVSIDIAALPSGFYFLDTSAGNNQNNQNNFFTLKVSVRKE